MNKVVLPIKMVSIEWKLDLVLFFSLYIWLCLIHCSECCRKASLSQWVGHFKESVFRDFVWYIFNISEMNTLEFLAKLFQRPRQLHLIGQNIHFVAELQSYLSVEIPESFVHCASIAGGFESESLKIYIIFAVLFGDISVVEITHLIFFYMFCIFVMRLWSFNFEGFYLMVRSVK